MKEIDVVLDGYTELFGDSDIKISALPQSGSDRKYFRINTGNKTVIGAYNQNPEENEAFIGFTKHFISKRLPVPEIFGYLPEKFVYYLQDLGDINMLADFLLQTKEDYFLYRDFQSANVMIFNGDPWFIDYQGGRKGAPQYDVCLLYTSDAADE